MLSTSFESTQFQSVHLIGDRGRIEVESPFVHQGSSQIRLVNADGIQIEPVPYHDQYVDQARDFEALVREGKPSLTPGTDAALTQAVIAAWKAG
jgi:predicted dehydrogenase